MYGIRSEKSIVETSKDLPRNWDALFVKSKEIYHQLAGLKEKHSQMVTQKAGRLAKQLDEVRQNFNTAGPSSETMSLDEGLESLTSFQQRLTHIDEQVKEMSHLKNQPHLIEFFSFQYVRAWS